MNLATIKNEVDNAIVMNLIEDSTSYWGPWIGFNDKANEDVFVWASDNDSDFTKWWHNEPNNWGNNEDCAQLNIHEPAYGFWNDNNCAN